MERRIKELEEAFSRVSDEGDALEAEKEGYEHDLVVAAEEHAKTLAELDAATARHEADHQSVIDLMDDLTRAREEAGALREALGRLEPMVCSWTCPSVKRTGEEWTHSAEHETIRALLSPCCEAAEFDGTYSARCPKHSGATTPHDSSGHPIAHPLLTPASSPVCSRCDGSGNDPLKGRWIGPIPIGPCVGCGGTGARGHYGGSVTPCWCGETHGPIAGRSEEGKK